MKIALLTLAIGSDFKRTAHNGIQTKKMYCEKWGIDYIDDEDVVDTTKHLAWAKVNLILKVLYMCKYDMIVWVDGDTLIMNSDIRLEDLIDEVCQGKDLTLTKDWKMINTGVMFIKQSEWSIDFWNHVNSLNQFDYSDNWEQDAVVYCMSHNILQCQDYITIHAQQKKFNSYWYNWSYGDFILHFAGTFRQNVGTLEFLMNRFCPIKTDTDTDETFERRVKWLKEEAEKEQQDLNRRNKSTETRKNVGIIIATCDSKSHTSNSSIASSVLRMSMREILKQTYNVKIHIIMVCPTSSDPYPDYYMFNEWEDECRLKGITFTIVPYKGENKHASYDQWIQGYLACPTLDYYITIEDDYTITTKDVSMTDMISFYKQSFSDNKGYLASYTWDRYHGFHAAVSNGMISRETFESIKDILSVYYSYKIWNTASAQVSFSSMFLDNHISIKDLTPWMSIPFWESSTECIYYFGHLTSPFFFLPVQCKHVLI